MLSYPGLESKDHFRQEENEAFDLDGEIFQHKICYPYNPDQVKEIKAVDVRLGKNKAERNIKFILIHDFSIKRIKINNKRDNKRDNKRNEYCE